MIRVHRPLRLVAAVLTVGLLGAACGSPSKKAEGEVAESTTTTIAKGPETTASQLRTRLAGLLGEHVYLVGAATGASAGGRTDEFTAAVAALDGNSSALTENVGAVFGDATGEKFGAAWKKRTGALVGQGGDTATQELATLLNSEMSSLSVESLAGALTAQEQGLKAAADAQKGGNEAKAYTDLRAAANGAATLAATLTGGMAKADPDKIGGDPASKAAGLLATLNGGLREHVYLALAATRGALGGRNDEFTAAAAALGGNSNDIIAAVGSVYGAEGGKAFDPLWKKHIGFLVTYTQAIGAKDQAKADAAMEDLLQYTEDFGAFINAASPKLVKDAVADLVKTHVLTLKDVIDTQAARNWTAAYAKERTAADHMTMMATPLATTIVTQFPQNF